MTLVAEIEAAIGRLSGEDFAQLAKWIDEQRNLVRDRQVEQDSTSGALDFVLKEVDQDIATGKARPTDEICDQRKNRAAGPAKALE